jgi:hypothetical protein
MYTMVVKKCISWYGKYRYVQYLPGMCVRTVLLIDATSIQIVIQHRFYLCFFRNPFSFRLCLKGLDFGKP